MRRGSRGQSAGPTEQIAPRSSPEKARKIVIEPVKFYAEFEFWLGAICFTAIYWIVYWIVAVTFEHLLQSWDWYAVGVWWREWRRLLIGWCGFVLVAVLVVIKETENHFRWELDRKQRACGR